MANHQCRIFDRFDRPIALGHRGVPEKFQENTMAGFQHAVELGLDGVELDVMLTKDKKLVVFHDVETERLTGFKGRVPDMTWDQLKELEVKDRILVGDGRIIDYQKKEKIALLEDVLEETRGKMVVDIEIKAYSLDFKQRHVGTELGKLIERRNLFNDVFVTSFNFFPLVWLERYCKRIESGFTYSPGPILGRSWLHNLMESSRLGKLFGSTLTNMSINMIDGDTIEKVQKRKMGLGAWTVFSHDWSWLGGEISEERQLEMVKDYCRRGIDYFITDDPVRLRSILQGLPQQTQSVH